MLWQNAPEVKDCYMCGEGSHNSKLQTHLSCFSHFTVSFPFASLHSAVRAVFRILFRVPPVPSGVEGFALKFLLCFSVYFRGWPFVVAASVFLYSHSFPSHAICISLFLFPLRPSVFVPMNRDYAVTGRALLALRSSGRPGT